MLILHPTQQPLVPTRGPADWQAHLADPEKHWKDGRSAKMLAEAWEGALPDMPPEVRQALAGTAFESFRPHLAVPEYCVELPGGRAASQNDLYVLGRIGSDLAVMMVEGKVDESFGPLLADCGDLGCGTVSGRLLRLGSGRCAWHLRGPSGSGHGRGARSPTSQAAPVPHR
jgi:hypothetical protein